MVEITAHSPLSKGGRTRQAILDVAVAQFATVGLRGTSVPGIARELGLTPSAVYAYFATKEALFDAAVDFDVAGLIADALPDVLAGSFDGTFGPVFQRLLAALPAHALARRVLAGQETRGPERLVTLPAEIRLQRGIATALRRGQNEGTVRFDIDPELMAVGLEAIVEALLIAILQTGDAVDPNISRGVLAVLEAALRPPT